MCVRARLKGCLWGRDSKSSYVAGCEGKERCPTHQQASLEEGPQWYYNGRHNGLLSKSRWIVVTNWWLENLHSRDVSATTASNDFPKQLAIVLYPMTCSIFA